MGDEISYEGYVIKSIPGELTPSSGWKVYIKIWRETADEQNHKSFFVAESFVTREDAFAHGFNFGKQIIDGEAKGLSVSNL